MLVTIVLLEHLLKPQLMASPEAFARQDVIALKVHQYRNYAHQGRIQIALGTRHLVIVFNVNQGSIVVIQALISHQGRVMLDIIVQVARTIVTLLNIGTYGPILPFKCFI